MNDRQAGYLAERLDSLPQLGRRRILEYLRFEEEKALPWNAQRADYLEQEYLAKLEKVRALKKTVDSIAAAARAMLETTLPKEEKALLTEFELLIFFIFLANFKPYCLFNQKGSFLKAAEKSIKRVLKLLEKLKKAEGMTSGGRNDKP